MEKAPRLLEQEIEELRQELDQLNEKISEPNPKTSKMLEHLAFTQGVRTLVHTAVELHCMRQRDNQIIQAIKECERGISSASALIDNSLRSAANSISGEVEISVETPFFGRRTFRS